MEWEDSPFEWRYVRADPDSYERWKSGILMDEWYAADGDAADGLLQPYDVRLAGRGRAKPQYSAGFHYAEWFAARHYKREGNWRALIEKYTMERLRDPVVRRLYELARDVMGDALVETMRICERDPRGMPPDLVLYRLPLSAREWFFCEVKHRDRLKDEQAARFAELQTETGRRVVMFRVTDSQPFIRYADAWDARASKPGPTAAPQP